MKERTLRRRLAVHIAVRLLVATVLLGAAVVVQLRSPGALPINPFYFLVGLTFAVSLGFIASLQFVERLPWLTDVHFAIDSIVVSAAVLITGGVESLFVILYMLPIVAASTVQFRRGGIQLAVLNTILFVGVVVAQYLSANGYLELPYENLVAMDLPPVNVAQYTVALNAFGFFAVAVLSGSLAERARRGEAQLEQATEEIADLQAFNQYVLDNLLSGLATADADNRLLTFNRSAMMITGSLWPKLRKRSNSPPGKASINWCDRAVISGARAAIRREVKARSTSPRRRVWRGGSSSSMECASTA